jgi:hypothetical protein
MRTLLLAPLLLAPLVFSPVEAPAKDQGQYAHVPEHIRAWFKSVRSAKGVPCCDISDGHRTDYDMRENNYWVPIGGTWMQVPAEAVIPDSGNPTGDAVVWYAKHGELIVIRCFVPGGGV